MGDERRLPAAGRAARGEPFAEIGRDDFALGRVPEASRYGWWSVAVQRFGQISDLSQLLLGATLGFSMTFRGAFWALTLGALILELVAILTGIAGQREGLSTSVLARWSGFGSLGAAIVIIATLKINSWNLYSSSLGLVNLLHQTAGRRANRSAVTIALGAIGTALSAAGILQHFTGFLTLLGIAFPPIAGIMVAEYYVVRRHRAELDRTRASGALPARAESLHPVTLVSWAAGAAAGYFVHAGIPALSSFLCGLVTYVVLMKAAERIPRRPASRR